jgi:hypothetical protein
MRVVTVPVNQAESGPALGARTLRPRVKFYKRDSYKASGSVARRRLRRQRLRIQLDLLRSR